MKINLKKLNEKEVYKILPISKIFIDNNNMADYYMEDVEELTLSLKQHGQLNFIRVYKETENIHIIITGNRRYLAAKKIDLPLKCIVVPKPNKLEYLYYILIDTIHYHQIPASQMLKMINGLVKRGESYEDITDNLCKNKYFFKSCQRLYGLEINDNKMCYNEELIAVIKKLNEQFVLDFNNLDNGLLERAIQMSNFPLTYNLIPRNSYIRNKKKPKDYKRYNKKTNLVFLLRRIKIRKKEIEITPKNTVFLKQEQIDTIMRAIENVFIEIGYSIIRN